MGEEEVVVVEDQVSPHRREVSLAAHVSSLGRSCAFRGFGHYAIMLAVPG